MTCKKVLRYIINIISSIIFAILGVGFYYFATENKVCIGTVPLGELIKLFFVLFFSFWAFMGFKSTFIRSRNQDKIKKHIEEVTAKAKYVIELEFYAKSHNVKQATYINVKTEEISFIEHYDEDGFPLRIKPKINKIIS